VCPLDRKVGSESIGVFSFRMLKRTMWKERNNPTFSGAELSIIELHYFLDCCLSGLVQLKHSKSLFIYIYIYIYIYI
jgi:hypothetical protein